MLSVLPPSPPCRLHPADLGHAALAELLAHPLIRAVWEVQAGEALGQVGPAATTCLAYSARSPELRQMFRRRAVPLTSGLPPWLQADRRAHPSVATLPPPMIPGSQDTTTSFCAMLVS